MNINKYSLLSISPKLVEGISRSLWVWGEISYGQFVALEVKEKLAYPFTLSSFRVALLASSTLFPSPTSFKT